jgi:hypothetical protein
MEEVDVDFDALATTGAHSLVVVLIHAVSVPANIAIVESVLDIRFVATASATTINPLGVVLTHAVPVAVNCAYVGSCLGVACIGMGGDGNST